MLAFTSRCSANTYILCWQQQKVTRVNRKMLPKSLLPHFGIHQSLLRSLIELLLYRVSHKSAYNFVNACISVFCGLILLILE
jgi:hypothetical protein